MFFFYLFRQFKADWGLGRMSKHIPVRYYICLLFMNMFKSNNWKIFRLERDNTPPPSWVPCRFIIIIFLYFLSVIVDRRFSNNKNFDGNYISPISIPQPIVILFRLFSGCPYHKINSKTSSGLFNLCNPTWWVLDTFTVFIVVHRGASISYCPN